MASETENNEEKQPIIEEQPETAEQAVAEPACEEDELTKLQAEAAALQDKYLRQAAEFDNYRKRVMREKADLVKTGGERVITSILPVLDDFERAADSMEQATDVQSVKQGVALIIEKLVSTLKREGLEKIEAVGQPFDTDFHEAIAMVPATADEQKGKVIDCVQAGYKLGDKVIRHAKVAVAQ